MLSLLVLAVMGIASGYVSVWTTVVFNESTEERVRSLLLGVVIDVIMLALFAMNGYGNVFSWFLVFKYAFLSTINYDETLRQ